ncbi:MAG: hypothetical protein ABEJ64_03810 [Candidatus Nanohaloarchaea archaeon]
MSTDQDYVEAGDHPEDHETAMDYDLSRIANDEGYDGQPVGLERVPGKGVQGHAENDDSDEIRGLMPRDEEVLEEDDGVDVVR